MGLRTQSDQITGGAPQTRPTEDYWNKDDHSNHNGLVSDHSAAPASNSPWLRSMLPDDFSMNDSARQFPSDQHVRAEEIHPQSFINSPLNIPDVSNYPTIASSSQNFRPATANTCHRNSPELQRILQPISASQQHQLPQCFSDAAIEQHQQSQSIILSPVSHPHPLPPISHPNTSFTLPPLQRILHPPQRSEPPLAIRAPGHQIPLRLLARLPQQRWQGLLPSRETEDASEGEAWVCLVLILKLNPQALKLRNGRLEKVGGGKEAGRVNDLKGKLKERRKKRLILSF